MKKTFLTLAACSLLVSCAATDGTFVQATIKDDMTPCDGERRGRTDTKLKYGKDDIDIKWKSFVGESSEFRINLKPKPGYENKVVTIKGNWGKLPGGGSTSPAWLDIQDSAANLEKAGKKPDLVLCVPKGVPVGTEYKFDVGITDIGEIDPRAVVVP